jgi:hypothetical protein
MFHCFHNFSFLFSYSFFDPAVTLPESNLFEFGLHTRRAAMLMNQVALLPAIGEEDLANFYFETICNYIDQTAGNETDSNVDQMNLLFWAGVTASARDLIDLSEKYLSSNIALG